MWTRVSERGQVLAPEPAPEPVRVPAEPAQVREQAVLTGLLRTSTSHRRCRRHHRSMPRRANPLKVNSSRPASRVGFWLCPGLSLLVKPGSVSQPGSVCVSVTSAVGTSGDGGTTGSSGSGTGSVKSGESHSGSPSVSGSYASSGTTSSTIGGGAFTAAMAAHEPGAAAGPVDTGADTLAGVGGLAAAGLAAAGFAAAGFAAAGSGGVGAAGFAAAGLAAAGLLPPALAASAPLA